MSVYATADAVRLAANPDWRPGSAEPAAGSQDASSLTDTQLLDAVRQASAFIDSYIGARYATPVAPVDPAATPLTYPDPIGDWARDIGLYLATLTWRRNLPLEATDPVALRYAAAVASLVAVRDGKAVLSIPSGDPGTGNTGFSGLADPGSEGMFDAADAGYHPSGWVGVGGRRPWNWGGYLYG